MKVNTAPAGKAICSACVTVLVPGNRDDVTLVTEELQENLGATYPCTELVEASHNFQGRW